ncbi:hypothetical protein LJC24_01395 [Desulfococcaceae bacterium OttesenSCG-928-F15]|nr:hypothetical protein [Desulfococcaceae bacterium OttesenSCG-928-F15]
MYAFPHTFLRKRPSKKMAPALQKILKRFRLETFFKEEESRELEWGDFEKEFPAQALRGAYVAAPSLRDRKS